MISRRLLLKGTATAGSVLFAPAVLRATDALASAGQVNVFAWGDYIQQNQIDKFEGDTGIKISLSTYGSNDEALQKLKASGGKGFDVIFPSITTGPMYYPDDLLMPLEEKKLVNADNLFQPMVDSSVQLGGIHRGQRMLMPFNWGTEAITFDSEVFPLNDDEVSYGALWGEVAQAACRQKSVLWGVGLHLDATGEVPSNRMLDVYKSEDEARRVFDAVTAFIVSHKDNLVAFWNNATEATNAFKQAGANVGQTWDTTGLLLSRENPTWRYRMPTEGGMTWMDSIGIPSGAENIEQAYAFINAQFTPEMGGLMSKNTGYNSAVDGAADHAGEVYERQFGEVYNADNLANLWWWQVDRPWTMTGAIQKYVDRITNA